MGTAPEPQAGRGGKRGQRMDAVGSEMDAEGLALLTATLDQLARAHDGAELTKALDDFGFPEVLATSPREAASSLFTAMGQAGTTSAAFQDVLIGNASGRLLGPDAGEAQSIVLPPVGAATAGRVDAGSITLRGLILGQRTNVGPLLVPADSADGVVWVRLPADLPAERLAIRSVAGLDPALMMAEVTATGPADVVLGGPAADQAWRAVVAAGRRALAYQIVGAVTAMLDLAVTHARDRVQFGQPIGAFQAVRHRLADAYVAREGAAAALDICWEADDEELAAMLAKSLAGRAARIAATQCQQVLAGIGFTAEHPFHRYLARALVLDQLLGSATDLPAQIGARLAAAGTLPRLADL